MKSFKEQEAGLDSSLRQQLWWALEHSSCQVSSVETHCITIVGGNRIFRITAQLPFSKLEDLLVDLYVGPPTWILRINADLELTRSRQRLKQTRHREGQPALREHFSANRLVSQRAVVRYLTGGIRQPQFNLVVQSVIQLSTSLRRQNLKLPHQCHHLLRIEEILPPVYRKI